MKTLSLTLRRVRASVRTDVNTGSRIKVQGGGGCNYGTCPPGSGCYNTGNPPPGGGGIGVVAIGNPPALG
ncbi:MAG: hypothetical protein U0174_13050 [Polyangiaceae bacterium]